MIDNSFEEILRSINTCDSTLRIIEITGVGWLVVVSIANLCFTRRLQSFAIWFAQQPLLILANSLITTALAVAFFAYFKLPELMIWLVALASAGWLIYAFCFREARLDWIRGTNFILLARTGGVMILVGIVIWTAVFAIPSWNDCQYFQHLRLFPDRWDMPSSR